MMNQVSVVRFAGRKMFATAVFGALVAAAAAQGVANAQTREVAVRTLGGPNRFSGPMHGVDDLRTMVSTNQSQITSALGQAGLGDITTQWFNTVNTGYVSDTTVAPGTHFVWMALKRAGRPGVLRNVRWTGSQSFDAFQFSVEANGYNYTFIVPKICGNFALLSRTAVVAAAPPPAPAPPPPPEPAPEPPPVVQAPPPPAPAAATLRQEYPWIVGFSLGSSWGGNSTGTVFVNPAVVNPAIQTTSLGIATSGSDGGLNYGIQLAYLGRYVGGEFLGDFAPHYKIDSVALQDEPSVNSWMFNVIGGFPILSGDRFHPYASAGVGGVTMRTSTFTLDGSNIFVGPNTTVVTLSTINNTQTKFAYDIGAGFFLGAARWGVRTDIRYYRVATNDAEKLQNGPTPAADFTQGLLSGLHYWRANLGIAYRF